MSLVSFLIPLRLPIETTANEIHGGVSFLPNLEDRATAKQDAEFLVFGRNPIPGGFLGVDIFFVISGYLITSLILKGIEQGDFSFADFYERRARRILPILLTVILAALPFAWFLFLPQAMIDFTYSIITSIFLRLITDLFDSNRYPLHKMSPGEAISEFLG